MNKGLIRYNETVFEKVKKFLNKFFKKNESKEILNKNKDKNNFIENIVISKNEEEKRLKELKKLYDNMELNEKNISNEDLDKLIEMYNNEIEELRTDTKIRKTKIEKMIQTKNKSGH